MATAHEVVEQVLDPGRDGADPALTDPVAVYRANGSHLRSRPAVEHFVRDIQLGAVHLALGHRDVQLFLAEAQERAAGNALQNAARRARRNRHAVADDEQARRRPLGNFTVGIEQNRLVVAVPIGLDERDAAVLVVGDALDPWRERVIRDARPRANPGLEHGPGAQDGIERLGPNQHTGTTVFQGAEPVGIGMVGQRTDVDIATMVVGLQHVHGRRRQILRAVRDGHALHLHGVVEPLEVLQELPAVELLVVGIPVSLDPLEHTAHRGPAQETDMHCGLLPRHQLTVKPEIRRTTGIAHCVALLYCL